jgi:glycosyltransferase involved in cell wall biosynthesis
MPKNSVLIIGPTPPPAQGVAVFTLALLRSNLGSAFRIVHLDTSDRRTLANIGRLDFRNIVLALRHGLQFQWLILRRQPDLIYMPVATTTLGFLRDCLFLASARLFGRRLVIQLHGGGLDSLYAEANSALRWLMRFCLGHVTRAIVLGECFRQDFDGLLPLQRIRVVPVGIAPGIWEAAKKVAGGRKAGRKQVLYLGMLVESKGFWDLIRAVPYVLQETKDIEFRFVGDTSLPEAQAAKEWVQEHSLDDFVKFLGPKWGDEKTQVLLEADIFAFPTWYPLEGQPAVVLEAMAAGLPIITTRHATIPDMLGEEGAFYVKQRDPKDIAEKLCLLLRSEDVRRKMGLTNQERFVQCYTLERLTQNMGDAFEEALSSS